MKQTHGKMISYNKITLPLKNSKQFESSPNTFSKQAGLLNLYPSWFDWILELNNLLLKNLSLIILFTSQIFLKVVQKCWKKLGLLETTSTSQIGKIGGLLYLYSKTSALHIEKIEVHYLHIYLLFVLHLNTFQVNWKALLSRLFTTRICQT